jgi:hypothetical protein
VTWFIFQTAPWVLPAFMLVVLALAVELPYRFLRPKDGAPGVSDEVLNGVQAGLFTLAAFVLGLSFAQASERFDLRRSLVVKEANSIGTTWLRADQLPPAKATTFRHTLTAYTAVRLTAYQTPFDSKAIDEALHASYVDQDTLWGTASAALRAHPANLGLSLLMATLNDTIDVSAEQLQELTSHVPTAMLMLTLALVGLSAFATGVRFARAGSRPPIITATMILAYVVVIAMNVDYDLPQKGFVTVDLKPLQLQLQSMQNTP